MARLTFTVFFLRHTIIQSEIKFAFVNEFSVAGINLLQDTLTGGTCFHIVSLLEAPVKRTVVALESILGKLMCVLICPQSLVFSLLHISLTNLKGTENSVKTQDYIFGPPIHSLYCKLKW